MVLIFIFCWCESENDNRAVYKRENKPRLTLAAAYVRRERNHLYEYGLHKTRTARINGSWLKPGSYVQPMHL